MAKAKAKTDKTPEPEQLTGVAAKLAGTNNAFAHDLRALIEAGFQCALVTTHEIVRCNDVLQALMRELDEACQRRHGNAHKPYDLVHWTVTHGFSVAVHDPNNPHGTRWENLAVQQQTKALEITGMTVLDPVQALRAIPNLGKLNVSENAIVVMNDVHTFLNVSQPMRTLLTQMHAHHQFFNNHSARFVLFRQNTVAWPAECEHVIRRVELPLPDDDGLEYVLDRAEKPIAERSPQLLFNSEVRPAVIRGLRGLGARQADDVLALSAIARSKADAAASPTEALHVIEQFKASAITNPGLTYVPKSQIQDISNICGYDAFLAALTRSALAYTPEARRAKIDTPRGYVLVGVPGSGKSQIAYATAKALDMPLIMFDPSQMLGSLVGQTETRVKDALHTIEAQRGSVVVIDELDKMLVTSNGSSDGGVSMRMFGIILRWLQERKDESVVIVTLNRTDGIDPELFRSGRFDGVYGVSLPEADVREDILRVHFAKRGVPESMLFWDDDNWQEFSDSTEGLLGSDIEEIVKVSRIKTLQRLKEDGQTIKDVIVPNFSELRAAIAEVREQSITHLEPARVKAMCDFVKASCRPVYSPRSGLQRARSRRLALDKA